MFTQTQTQTQSQSTTLRKANKPITNITTVIFNDEYISEVTRHRDIAKRRYETENMPEEKEHYRMEYEQWEKKLEWAVSFQDTLDSLQNIEVPSLTVCKTLSGLVIPAKHLQII